MKRYILAIFLVGCTTVGVADVAVERALGAEPTAPIVNDIYWHVVDGNLQISPQDGVKLNVQLKDQLRYTKQLQNLVCYYEPRHTFCNNKDKDVQ